MARKVIILARIIGLPLTLETLSVENIVPEPIRDVASTDEFMRKLPHFDAHFNKLNRDAASNGHVLRYVGLVDSTDPAKCCVKLITCVLGYSIGFLSFLSFSLYLSFPYPLFLPLYCLPLPFLPPPIF